MCGIVKEHQDATRDPHMEGSDPHMEGSDPNPMEGSRVLRDLRAVWSVWAEGILA